MNHSAGKVQQILDQAIENTHAGRYGEAGEGFLRALEEIENHSDGADQSEQLGMLADLCSQAGHPDLALMALRGRLNSPVSETNPTQHCADLLTLANSWGGLGRSAAGAAANEAALAYALAHQLFADAASASTNLAMHAANSGQLPASLERLQTSLKYLEQDCNPDTDAITRLSLLQVVDALGADPAIALEASAPLFTRLEPQVGPERWQGVAPAFERLVERYLAGHPELDAEAWKSETFPQVFGGA